VVIKNDDIRHQINWPTLGGAKKNWRDIFGDPICQVVFQAKTSLRAKTRLRSISILNDQRDMDDLTIFCQTVCIDCLTRRGARVQGLGKRKTHQQVQWFPGIKFGTVMLQKWFCEFFLFESQHC
jgi:hypothetical protein